MDDYAILHFLDNMAGKEQGLLNLLFLESKVAVCRIFSSGVEVVVQ